MLPMNLSEEGLYKLDPKGSSFLVVGEKYKHLPI